MRRCSRQLVEDRLRIEQCLQLRRLGVTPCGKVEKSGRS